jgi:CubicO group peptidase (beta-lactamase class C family)
MVVHKGIPVAEAYKPGFSEDTRFLSWSMAKSFVNAFAGIMAGEGLLDVNSPAGIEEWEGDERRNITINDLLQMQSGLEWNEDYGNRSDVTVMLHCDDDMSRYAFDRPARYPAGTKWYYSSGTTNIVSYILRKKTGNDDEYYTFLHRNLFSRTGIRDAVFEVDPEGTMVGSSYLYLTARDYARFGLLYLNDGVFNGERILPEGWVEYSTTPASDSGGEYGAFFWLNRSGKLPSAPRDMYMCVGHDGQRIFIIPSMEMVVVVLGYSPSSNGGMDFDTLLRDILGSVKG